MSGLKRGGDAIVGAAESDLGQVADGMSPLDLMAQGTQRALADCGLALKDVDGLFCATAQSRLSVLAFAEYLGVQPAYVLLGLLGLLASAAIVGGLALVFSGLPAPTATRRRIVEPEP